MILSILRVKNIFSAKKVKRNFQTGKILYAQSILMAQVREGKASL